MKKYIFLFIIIVVIMSWFVNYSYLFCAEHHLHCVLIGSDSQAAENTNTSHHHNTNDSLLHELSHTDQLTESNVFASLNDIYNFYEFFTNDDNAVHSFSLSNIIITSFKKTHRFKKSREMLSMESLLLI